MTLPKPPGTSVTGCRTLMKTPSVRLQTNTAFVPSEKKKNDGSTELKETDILALCCANYLTSVMMRTLVIICATFLWKMSVHLW